MKLIESHDIDDYEKILNSSLSNPNELGEGVLKSVAKYCSSDRKDSHYWRMYLFNHNDLNIGITGIYSLEDSFDELWLGWFGLNEHYRGQHLSDKMLELTLDEVNKLDCRTFKLYTGSDNVRAQSLYQKHGFVFLHTVEQEILQKHYHLDKFGDTNDWVFVRQMQSTKVKT